MQITFDSSKLSANITAIRERVAGEGTSRVVREGARVIAEVMIAATPEQTERNPGSDSLEVGEMKANIKARTSTRDGEPVGLAGPTGKGGKIAKAAHNLEYGHRIVTGGVSKLGADGKYHGAGKVHEEDVPPHPTFRPAFESSQEAALERMAEVMAEEIEAAVTE